MFTDAEKTLLNAPAPGFPMIGAASSALRRCGTCGHAGMDPRSILMAAVCRYRRDPKFIEHCRKLMKLPVSIAGIVIGD